MIFSPGEALHPCQKFKIVYLIKKNQSGHFLFEMWHSEHQDPDLDPGLRGNAGSRSATLVQISICFATGSVPVLYYRHLIHCTRIYVPILIKKMRLNSWKLNVFISAFRNWPFVSFRTDFDWWKCSDPEYLCKFHSGCRKNYGYWRTRSTA